MLHDADSDPDASEWEVLRSAQCRHASEAGTAGPCPNGAWRLQTGKILHMARPAAVAENGCCTRDLALTDVGFGSDTTTPADATSVISDGQA
jgi:hypothetical protein